MNPPLAIMQSKVIAQRVTSAFVDGPRRHSIEAVKVDVYPPGRVAAGEALRQFRHTMNVSLHEASRACGDIGAVAYCSLETGKAYVCDADMARIKAAMRHIKAAQ